jgi:predicted cupin superfamily sugar epimerase
VREIQRSRHVWLRVRTYEAPRQFISTIQAVDEGASGIEASRHRVTLIYLNLAADSLFRAPWHTISLARDGWPSLPPSSAQRSAIGDMSHPAVSSFSDRSFRMEVVSEAECIFGSCTKEGLEMELRRLACAPCTPFGFASCAHMSAHNI